MLRLCPSCRAEIQSQSNICFACGESLDTPKASDATNQFLEFALAGRKYSPKGVDHLPTGTCIANRWSVITQLDDENGWATYCVDDLEQGGRRILQLSSESHQLNKTVFDLKESPYFCKQDSFLINGWSALVSDEPDAIQYNTKNDWSFFAAAAAWIDHAWCDPMWRLPHLPECCSPALSAEGIRSIYL